MTSAQRWIAGLGIAALSLVGGYINIPRWLEPMFKPVEEAPGTEWTVYVSVAAGLIGIALAYIFSVFASGLPESYARTFSVHYGWIYNKSLWAQF